VPQVSVSAPRDHAASPDVQARTTVGRCPVVLTSWLITTVIFLTAIAGAGHVAAVGSHAT
jgi:hypothetical protein